MAYFTNSLPNLLSEKRWDVLEHDFNNVKKNSTGMMEKIYNNIIYPYQGVWISVILIAVILYYLYRQKNENFGGMDSPYERIARPTFNPRYPVSEQTPYVNYLPDHVPVISNGEFKDNVQVIPRTPITNIDTRQEDILARDYVAPPQHNEYQYSGPYYRGTSEIVSDDEYKEFAAANEENLAQFDDLLNQKMLGDFVNLEK